MIRPLRAFTVLGVEMNPVEYTRRYADECDGVTEAVGFLLAVRCTFDRCKGDPVHDRLVGCFSGEAVGGDSVCKLYAVYVTGSEPYPCVCREFAFVPQSVIFSPAGKSLPAQSFTGVFNARGMAVSGLATLVDGGKTLSFCEVLNV